MPSDGSRLPSIPTALSVTPRAGPRKKAGLRQNFKPTDLSRCCATWHASRCRTRPKNAATRSECFSLIARITAGKLELSRPEFACEHDTRWHVIYRFRWFCAAAVGAKRVLRPIAPRALACVAELAPCLSLL